MNKVYDVASSDIYGERFGDDLVVLNLSTGQYFGFNASAALVWQGLIEHKASVERLGEAGLDLQSLDACVARLEELGLISPGNHPPGALPAELATRVAAARIEPAIECYDDLASLILADPIHDVEGEAGWPRITGET